MNTGATDNPYLVLLGHNHWATGEILDRCRSLSREQFHQRFEIGLGSLHNTLTHIIGAMLRWSDRIAERPVRPTIERRPAWFTGASEARDRDPPELRALLDEGTADLRSVIEARQHEPGHVLSIELASPGGAKQYSLTVNGALLHALTHGLYHRAQCMNMLRHLAIPGISDTLPDLDVSEWPTFADRPH